MMEYLNEQYAFDALYKTIQKAVNRKLTDKEIQHIIWLTKMDCETIDVFVKLFADTVKTE